MTSKLIASSPCPTYHLCQLASTFVQMFSKYRFQTSRCDGWMNKLTGWKHCASCQFTQWINPAFEWHQFQWPWVTSNPDFKVTNYSTSNNSKTVQDRAIFTMADQHKVIHCLPNDAIFNDLEQLLTQFSRSCQSLMLDVSQTAKGTAIVTMECE